MTNIVDKQTYEFLINDDFILYVIDPASNLCGKWDNFFSLHPDQLPFANEAKLILEGKTNPINIKTEDFDEMKTEIFKVCDVYSNN